MSFFGAPYPIVKNARGLLRTQNGLEQIKSDLLILLLTNPGERVMLPDYGTPLNTLVFEPNDRGINETARNMIINSITTWEPRIVVEEISVSVPQAGERPAILEENIENSLEIKIRFFDPEQIAEVQELVLEVPLAGG